MQDADVPEVEPQPTELEILARQGNPAALRQLRDNALHRFLGQNADLSCLKGRLWIHFDNPDGWIKQYVVIDEGTSEADIHNGWRHVKQWRDRLLAFQGPWRGGGDGGLYDEITRWNRRRHRSYAQIAKRLNESAVSYLRKHLEDQAAFNAALPASWTYGDLFKWQAETGCFGFGRDHAVGLMMAMGMSPQDADVWCDSILDNLRQGEPAVAGPGVPICGDQVRSRIRAWEARQPRRGPE